MSVATRNPFAVLDEEASIPSSPVPAPAPASAEPPVSAPSTRGNQRGRGGPASRGGRYYPRGGARNNAERDATTVEEPAAGAEGTQRKFDGERREGRGRGRGGRGDATGMIDSDKKVHNSWGGDDGNAELKTEEAATIDAAAESGGVNDWAAPAADADADPWGAPAPEGAADATPAAEGEKPDGGRRKEREPEEEDNTLTLEEYLAQKKESDLVPKLEARKANDGADETLWDGATVLKKGDGEAYFSGKTKSAPKAREKKEAKIHIEIEARFERPSRGGRGRGGDRGGEGRGEGRGRGTGRGRGSRGRGGANGNPVVRVDDEAAFPSLS
ncbi:hypothetical protein BU15DRAFT_87252 [Melanogaster broomeanus]|nr:hypothetical protein BU15DRAFT_87252 [Melanogaster broomeanus]